MDSKLKLEIFAYDIFQTAFWSHKLLQCKPKIFDIYEVQFSEDPSCDEACDDLFHKAIFCRRELFHIIHKGELMYEKIESCKSPTDVFDYMIHHCDQDYLFHNLNVFERMFATCAFVVTMCVHIHWYNVVDVISNGHKFWMRFFDKYIGEFYKEGGWNKLKEIAKPYDLMYEFLAIFTENFDSYLSAIKEAIVNYQHFKADVLPCYAAKANECKPVFKMWVSFHCKNLENYFKIPASYEVSLNPKTIELLLMELKQFCNPRHFSDSVSQTGDYCSADDMLLERYRVKNICEIESNSDDSCSSKEGSDSDKSPERYQGKDLSADMVSETFNTLAINAEVELPTDDACSSKKCSDNDKTQKKDRGKDFSAGMHSKTCKNFASNAEEESI